MRYERGEKIFEADDDGEWEACSDAGDVDVDLADIALREKMKKEGGTRKGEGTYKVKHGKEREKEKKSACNCVIS